MKQIKLCKLLNKMFFSIKLNRSKSRYTSYQICLKNRKEADFLYISSSLFNILFTVFCCSWGTKKTHTNFVLIKFCHEKKMYWKIIRSNIKFEFPLNISEYFAYMGDISLSAYWTKTYYIFLLQKNVFVFVVPFFIWPQK